MKKTKPLRAWKAGDTFLIPLSNGGAVLGQILTAEPAVLNSVSCALFDQDGAATTRPDVQRLFSVVMTTRDLLDSGGWRIIGTHEIEVPRHQFPFESLRAVGFVGAKVIGSRNIGEFANAFRGLVPWDDWADPFYLDKLLISPDMKPKGLLYKR